MPDRPSRAPVLVSYVAFVLVGVSAAVGGVLLPAQMRDYGVDMATIGLTFFTFSAGFLLAGTSAGAVVERLGTAHALVLGGGLYAATALFVSTRPSFAVFVVVQVLLGYGIGILEAVLNAYLSRLPGATTLLNRLHAFFGVGALLGPALAAGVLLTSPWTTVWLVLALGTLPLMVAFVLAHPRGVGRETTPSEPPTDGVATPVVRNDARGPAGARVAPPDDRSPAREPAREPARGLLAAALRQPAVLLAAAFLTVYVGLEATIGSWGYTYLVDERAQEPLLAGYSVSGYWLGLTLGRFLISPVATRLGLSANRMMAACLAGVAAATVLTWLGPQEVASVGLVLLGFFLGPLFPTAMAVVPRLTGHRLVPTAIGVLNGVSVLGSSVLPWLAGAIAAAAGLWSLLPYAVVLAVAQAAVWRSVAARMTPETVLDTEPR